VACISNALEILPLDIVKVPSVRLPPCNAPENVPDIAFVIAPLLIVVKPSVSVAPTMLPSEL